MNRRRALSLFSRAPLVAPLAMKAIQDEAAGKLLGLQSSGITNGSYDYPPAMPTGTSAEWSHYKAAFQIPSVKGEVESILFEQSQNVPALDIDIASKRSFSMAAKIAYQRQRNVAKRMDEMQKPYSWERISRIVAKFCGL